MASVRSVERLTPWRLWATGISAFCMRLSACSTTPRATRMSSPSTGTYEAATQRGPLVFACMDETSEAMPCTVEFNSSPFPFLRSSLMVAA